MQVLPAQRRAFVQHNFYTFWLTRRDHFAFHSGRGRGRRRRQNFLIGAAKNIFDGTPSDRIADRRVAQVPILRIYGTLGAAQRLFEPGKAPAQQIELVIQGTHSRSKPLYLLLEPVQFRIRCPPFLCHGGSFRQLPVAPLDYLAQARDRQNVMPNFLKYNHQTICKEKPTSAAVWRASSSHGARVAWHCARRTAPGSTPPTPSLAGTALGAERTASGARPGGKV